MSKIYEFLKEKATDANYQNKIYYIENNFYEKGDVSARYTFKETYDAVNECIKIFKNNNLKNRPCIVTVAAVLEDIITTIALMELGAKPILVQKDSLYVYSSKKETNISNNFSYDVIPLVRMDNNKKIILNETILDGVQPETGIHEIANIKDIKKLIDDNIIFSEIENNDFDFGLLTSGTTGKRKVFGMKENILMNKINNDYELNNSELFLCQNPISAISGLLFTMYIPIIGNNKATAVCFSQNYKNDLENIDYDTVNLISATSFFNKTYAINKYYPLLNDDTYEKVNKITLLGSKISADCFSFLHMIFPNVKEGNIWAFYGRTENYGLVSKVNEKEIRPVYIYQQQIFPNQIIYSYDKNNVYEITSIGNHLYKKESPIKYNDEDFTSISNIAIKRNDNVNVLAPIFGEIKAFDYKTGDYGFTLDNNIYLLSRENELLKTNNGYIHIPWFEKIFNSLISTLIPNENIECFFLKDNNKLKLYIPCLVKPYCTDNFARYRVNLRAIFDKIKKSGFEVILFNENDLRLGDEIGKFKKYKLHDLKSNYKAEDIDSEEDVNKALNKELSSLLNKKIELQKDIYTDLYIFPKNIFKVEDLAKIILNFKVLEFVDDSSNYYLAISDEFLLAKFQDDKIRSILSKEEIMEKIENGKIREYLMYANKLIEKEIYKIGLYKNEMNRLTAVILDEFTYPEKRNIHNPLRDMEKYKKKSEAIFEEVVCFNKYDYYYRDYFKTTEYSIDENNIFYRDNKKYPCGYYTPDICYIMYGFLLKHKNDLEKGEKKYDKH